MDLGHWESKCGEPIGFEELDFIGFVYIIKNNKDNKSYIGKKQCMTIVRRPPLKGKKRKRLIKNQTDWKKYTGSSNYLNDDIEKHGIENFSFLILKWCNSKWMLGYEEAKLQFEEEVLLTDKYYNGIINLRIGKRPKSADVEILLG